MKFTSLVIIAFVCMNSYGQWKLLTPKYPNTMVVDVASTPSGKLFATGTEVNGTTYTPIVFRSRDNGLHWDTAHIAPNGYFFETIAFLNESIGYIGVGGGAYMVQTTDTGHTWNYFYQNPSGTAINDIEVIDSENAVACGFGPSFYSSGCAYTLSHQTDWAPTAQTFPTTTLDDMQMLNKNEGFALSLFGKEIFSTQNGGNTWTNIYDFPTMVEKMFWWDKNSGIAVGLKAHYYTTTDGGLHWTSDSLSGFSNELTGVAFFDANNGFICGTRGKIFRSADGGHSWTPESYVTGNDFYHLEIHGHYAYALGANGTIARRENPVSITKIENPGITLNVVPNPADQSLQVSSSREIQTITVTNISGEIIFKTLGILSRDYLLETASFANGIYFLHVSLARDTINRKLVICH